MTVQIIRGIFAIACVIMGGLWGYYLAEQANKQDFFGWIVLGGLGGGLVAGMVTALLFFITQELYERLAPALISIVLAMIVGYFIGQYILMWYPDTEVGLQVFVVVSMVLVCGFAGTMLGLTRASNWESLITAVQRHGGDGVSLKLVDTSVLIDGRILDIAASGFVEGTLLVPRFILQELQHIADSSDVLRRAKGRRGLDILKELQAPDAPTRVEIIDDDPNDIREVDSKLVKLAAKFGARILTTDFNLNKVAQIEGIMVLNINDLANALKPAVLPDEQMVVKIIKEGKEANQGVGYLDDGTMIVVDGGREFLGRTAAVVVTSVLQTAAGRMIFTRFETEVT